MITVKWKKVKQLLDDTFVATAVMLLTYSPGPGCSKVGWCYPLDKSPLDSIALSTFLTTGAWSLWLEHSQVTAVGLSLIFEVGNQVGSLPAALGHAFFPRERLWGRNGWQSPKNICVVGQEVGQVVISLLQHMGRYQK